MTQSSLPFDDADDLPENVSQEHSLQAAVWQTLTVDAGIDDGQARYQAVDPTQSFIVQAPAGSGKTALLTQRFLSLLSVVDAPENIVAMTFTKKAAAEMRERVVAALAEAKKPLSAGSNVFEQNTHRLAQAALQRDRQCGWRLEHNPGRLRIRTIDSLNSYLVQQMPYLSRHGMASQIADQPEALYRQAANRALSDCEDAQAEAAVMTLLRLVNGSYARAQNQLADMLGKRDQWMGSLLPFLAGEDDAEADHTARDMLQTALNDLVQQETRAALAWLTPLTRILNEAVALARVAQANGAKGLEGVALPEGLDAGSDRSVWRTLADWLLTGKGEWRKKMNKQQGVLSPSEVKGEEKVQRQQYKEQVEACLLGLREADADQQAGAALATLAGLPDPAYDDESWQALQHLLHLLRRAAAHLKLVFQQQGESDYIEIAQAASRALGEPDAPTDFAQQLDYRLQHLLIDEFQDTSVSQFALLEKLIAGWSPGDGHSLFLVGDPMQSIYRFREAEVANFLQAWHHGLGQLALTSLTLTVNFRASRGLVDWVNQAFATVMPPEDDMTTGAVCFAPAQSQKHDPAETVRCHGGFEPETDLAQVVAQVRQWQQTRPDGATLGILGRSRSHLKPIAQALKDTGIAFRAVELEALSERQEIQDLQALTLALTHLEDRAAWLALLRSPLVGLSLADLFALLGDRARFHDAVWSALTDSQRVQTLTEAGQAALAQAMPVLADALRLEGALPLSERVMQAWLQLGGARTLTTETARDNARVWQRMLMELEMAGTSVSGPTLAQALADLYALPDTSQAAEQVQLMTIHKSKGLEFDTVILPSLAKTGRSDDEPLVQWLSFKQDDALGQTQTRWVLAPLMQKGKSARAQADTRLNQLIKTFDQRKQRHELSRLLYVATTRAKRCLHLFVSMPPGRKAFDDPENLTPPKGSLLDILWPVLDTTLRDRFVQWVEQGGEPERNDDEPQASAVAKVARRRPDVPAFEPLTPGSPVGQENYQAWLKQQSQWQRYQQRHQPSATQTSESVGAEMPQRESASKANLAGSAADSVFGKTVGNLVHQVLQHWALAENAEADLARLETLQPWLRQQLGVALPSAQVAAALTRVMACLHNALNHQRVRWALSDDHLSAHSEWALSEVVPMGDQAQGLHTKVLHTVVDCALVDERGRRWIIDYKTNAGPTTLTEADKAAFVEQMKQAYAPQLGRYGELIARLESRPQTQVLYLCALDAWVVVRDEPEVS
ncbi:MAG: UvrD-helicase domain-containing protein [Hydrogenovibrio sp.]|uniref:UvrD-helicase domain-containing protein n=1 Tax=Hydrogenovibrio sp. TaxID=2065821 RepID=UPI00286FB41D|nr:UvrD-helicase domain-containing protein [Hydrogenovibrio sp.]MDR9499459.1 UvrD-helicase domain-containing protein [Hydrogenovibrio sp.]